ncbi:serine protease [Desulfobacter hydrogenophilus]|uniref:Serine protease n=1 Tax=Desulfobacter hydrogenophilus TaxID=2291 RepID=A0A328FFQ1_9BACT|nr:NfeD family protein [Desulfobacter hydrogenophilus]NDY70981.1 serine protease [Desulfobacter hydrogenophilus]QBH12779.1 serine protease [Desulfobacter hydrogenophilus]RAM03016.1 serine protease [Desulfobacter hydrogenophilus]
MNAWILPLILQIMGIFTVVAEVFLPSLGLLSITALGLIGYSLFLVFNAFPLSVFYAVIGADLILLPVAFILGFKALAVSPLSLKKKLSASQGVVSQSPDLKNYLDCTGHSITTLRPSGTALIDGVRLDVVTDGEFIEADTPLRVCKVTGNQVIVRRGENV